MSVDEVTSPGPDVAQYEELHRRFSELYPTLRRWFQDGKTISEAKSD